METIRTFAHVKQLKRIIMEMDEKIINELFAEYEKSYAETKEGQVFPQWLNDEQLKWVITVLMNNIKQ